MLSFGQGLAFKQKHQTIRDRELNDKGEFWNGEAELDAGLNSTGMIPESHGFVLFCFNEVTIRGERLAETQKQISVGTQ